MEQLHISENPKKHCTYCKREVFQTVHKSDSYSVDWYTVESKVICIDCYKDTNTIKNPNPS
jgi:hypothetical protein